MLKVSFSLTKLKIFPVSIDYLDKTYGILSEEPLRADSMIFSSSVIRMNNERSMSSIDSLL